MYRALLNVEFALQVQGKALYDLERQQAAAARAQRGAEVYITGVFTVFRQPDGIVEACKLFDRTLKAAVGL